jgi:hypothetical protein
VYQLLSIWSLLAVVQEVIIMAAAVALEALEPELLLQ